MSADLVTPLELIQIVHTIRANKEAYIATHAPQWLRYVSEKLKDRAAAVALGAAGSIDLELDWNTFTPTLAYQTALYVVERVKQGGIPAYIPHKQCISISLMLR